MNLKDDRFEYVRFDDVSAQVQADLLDSMRVLEHKINVLLKSARPKALALTKIEEAFMWVGKAIRDDQRDRTNGR